METPTHTEEPEPRRYGRRLFLVTLAGGLTSLYWGKAAWDHVTGVVSPVANAIAPRLNGGVSLAAVNAPELCVVAGTDTEIGAFADTLEAERIASTRLTRLPKLFARSALIRVIKASSENFAS